MHATALLLTALSLGGAAFIGTAITGAHDLYRRGAGGAGRILLRRAAPGLGMCLFVYLILPDMQVMIAVSLAIALALAATTIYLRWHATRAANRRSRQRYRGTRA